MNAKNLKIAMVREEVTPEQLCERAGFSTTSYYRKLKGETEFTQSEIASIAAILHLGRDEVISIFFDDKVS